MVQAVKTEMNTEFWNGNVHGTGRLEYKGVDRWCYNTEMDLREM